MATSKILENIRILFYSHSSDKSWKAKDSFRVNVHLFLLHILKNFKKIRMVLYISTRKNITTQNYSFRFLVEKILKKLSHFLSTKVGGEKQNSMLF